MSNAFVLYVDHQGHPAPLTECFHATASRRLSSTSYRYPVATSQEVDSAYCPQCMTFHDATTAAEQGYCSKPTCRRCPLCLSVSSISTSSTTSGGIECFFRCGLCRWTSKDCNISVVVPSDDPDGKLDRLELMRAAEEMSSHLAERRKQSMQSLDDLHQMQSGNWKNYRTRMRKLDARRHDDQWSLELLESKVKSKTDGLRTKFDDCSLPSGANVSVKRTSIQEIVANVSPQILTERFSDDLSLLSYDLQSMDAEPLLPLLIPLCLRQSRRCRAELADGRPGILLKPKLNPLEGDSSLPTGHGQWFRKDSSAIHVVPHVRVVQRHDLEIDDDSGHSRKLAFLLKVSNPTLGTVRLLLSKSTYAGETECWNEFPVNSEGVTSSFTALLVDTMSQSTFQAELKPGLTRNIEATEKVELTSAEDSIIEMGGKSRRTPEEVLNWSAPSDDTHKERSASLRLVSQSASDAWFELVVHDVDASASPTATAIPLALQVELGNGSWESSLIPVAEDTANDTVVFDLVVVFN